MSNTCGNSAWPRYKLVENARLSNCSEKLLLQVAFAVGSGQVAMQMASPSEQQVRLAFRLDSVSGNGMGEGMHFELKLLRCPNRQTRVCEL